MMTNDIDLYVFIINRMFLNSPHRLWTINGRSCFSRRRYSCCRCRCCCRATDLHYILGHINVSATGYGVRGSGQIWMEEVVISSCGDVHVYGVEWMRGVLKAIVRYMGSDA